MRTRALATVALAAVLLALAPPVSARTPARPAKPTWTLGGRPCTPIPVRAARPLAAPFAPAACPGIRPGALVESDTGLCTFNFLFRGGDGHRYIGSAGHCVLAAGEEKAWPAGKGPVARDETGRRIGEFAYAIFRDPRDFSLVRLDPRAAASADVCFFGGPTGLNADITGAPVVLQFAGNGVVIGGLLRARSAVALGMPSPDVVYANGVATPGDSGAGVLSSDGRAVGVLVSLGVHSMGVSSGLLGITRLAPQVARAQQVLRTTLTLQTARRH